MFKKILKNKKLGMSTRNIREQEVRKEKKVVYFSENGCIHRPESVLEKQIRKIPWDFESKMDHFFSPPENHNLF